MLDLGIVLECYKWSRSQISSRTHKSVLIFISYKTEELKLLNKNLLLLF